MPVPILASIVTGVGRLAGGVVRTIRRNRAARRAATGQPPRAGLLKRIGSGLRRLLTRKRNKSQRLQASANRVLARKIKDEARRNRINRRRFDRQLKRAGGDPAAFWRRNETPATPTVAELPEKAGGPGLLARLFQGQLRRPQEFQVPPDVKQAANTSGIVLDDAGMRAKRLGSPVPIIIAAIIALLIIRQQ